MSDIALPFPFLDSPYFCCYLSYSVNLMSFLDPLLVIYDGDVASFDCFHPLLTTDHDLMRITKISDD